MRPISLIIILSWLAIQLPFLAQGQQTKKLIKEAKYHIINPNGMDSIKLGITLIDSVITLFGSNYKVDTVTVTRFLDYHSEDPDSPKYKTTKHIKLIYAKIGLKIYYRIKDRTVSAIAVTNPFRVRTIEGIVLGKSTFGDADRVYGKEPVQFDKFHIWKEHDEFLFYSKNRKFLSFFTSGDRIQNRKIKGITINNQMAD